MTQLIDSAHNAQALHQTIDTFATPEDYLRDRVILITGASRGLGAALTKAAASFGAQVIMLARTTRDMEKIADDCLNEGFPEPSIVPMNLEGATLDDYHTVIDSVINAFGRLDGLVLNAGQLGELTPVEEYDPVTWAKVFQVNLHSQFLFLQVALSHLRNGPDSSIIVTGDAVGRQSRAYWGAYAVTKFASEGLVQTLADELESTSVRINIINPGKIKTRLRAQAYPAEDANSLPLPYTVLQPFLFLLGKAGAPYNGYSLDAREPSEDLRNSNDSS